MGRNLEAAIGFEPMHGGFADLSLNHLGTPPRVGRSPDRTHSTITRRKAHQLSIRVPSHSCSPFLYYSSTDANRVGRGTSMGSSDNETDKSQAIDTGALPGSDGEHRLQEKYGRTTHALAFYKHQVLDHLNSAMQNFLSRQEMMFVGTADAKGHADSAFRCGHAGFVKVLDERTIAYPEYRGNGVMASLGNISENPHVGLLFIDFGDQIGLHINGGAKRVENDEFLAF